MEENLPITVEVLPPSSQGNRIEKQPWSQIENEPSLWYSRFQVFLGLGPGRTLLETVRKCSNKPVKGPSGGWKQAQATWRWAERAREYDIREIVKANDTNSSYRHQAETNTEAAIARITQILRECVEEEDEEKYQKYAKKLHLLILGTGRAAEVLFKAHRCLFGERQHIESTHSFKTVVMEFE
jgi:hypothetical protein